MVKVAVVGATGNVGREMLQTLAERKFPADEVFAIASAKSAGKEVSFGDDAVLKVHDLEKFDFHGVDIALMSAGGSISEKYAPKILVVTDGSNGGYYYENGKAVHYDSVKVTAVDTNGAGDTFHGAFVAGYCKGMDVKSACEFASKAAGFKCANKGLRDLPFESLI